MYFLHEVDSHTTVERVVWKLAYAKCDRFEKRAHLCTATIALWA